MREREKNNIHFDLIGIYNVVLQEFLNNFILFKFFGLNVEKG